MRQLEGPQKTGRTDQHRTAYRNEEPMQNKPNNTPVRSVRVPNDEWSDMGEEAEHDQKANGGKRGITAYLRRLHKRARKRRLERQCEQQENSPSP